MEKYTKEELVKLIKETPVSVDEFADFKKQQGIEKKWEPIMSEPQNEPDDEEPATYKSTGMKFRAGQAKGEHIGHKVIDKTTGDALVVFYPCEKNIRDFVRDYKDAIESLKAQYGDVYISKNNTIPKCEPRRTSAKPEQLYKLSGHKAKQVDIRQRFEDEISDANYLKRYLIYPYVQEYLANKVNSHLEICSIPRLKVNERANLDRHSKFSNSILSYQSLNFNSYDSVKDFFNAAKEKVEGVEQSEGDQKYREYHLARQFNLLYRNWDKTTKSEKRFFGFTPIYNLEAYGLSPTAFDITVWSLLSVKGTLESTGDGYSFLWEAQFKTNHGRRIKNDPTVRDLKIAEDYSFVKSDRVKIDTSEIDVNSKDIIAKNEGVQNCLQGVLQQLADEILNIPISDQLKRAKVSSFELSSEERAEMRRKRQERLAAMDQGAEQPEQGGEEQPQLAESFVDVVVKNVLEQIKKQ